MKRNAFVVSMAVLVFSVVANAQHVVETIEAPPATYWTDIVLYETGGKLFIADNTNKQILVYDERTLGYLGAISLSAIPPGTPRSLALHEGTGTLYASISCSGATCDSTIAVIDADTYEIIDTITDIDCWRAKMTIDESRARLYAFGTNDMLFAIDVNTNSVVGILNVAGLFTEFGIIDISEKRGLNPVTGELFFTSRHADQFVVVDGPSLTGELILADGSRGWGDEATWNTHENKIYITSITWGGYFVYDRDTGASTMPGCVNDGTSLFYSPATNRVYSGSEVNGLATVIEGDTDACQNVEMEMGLPEVGFVSATHHAYFAGLGMVSVFDEDTLTAVATIYGGGHPLANFVGTRVTVNQSQRRVFKLGNWTYPEDGASILVIDDEDLLTITSPAGGELWQAGSPHDITWTDTGTIADVKIEYSIDDGSAWTTLVASTPNTHTYSWDLPNIGSFACLVRITDAADASVKDVSDAAFSIFIPFGIALDNAGLSWVTGGSADWMGESSVYYYGDSAAQSGPIWNSGQSTYIQTTVSGPGTLNFFWKVSSYYYSSEYYNNLSFRIDDVEMKKIGGEIGWEQQQYQISAGTHTLRWRYYQILPPSPGSLNAAWLDRVEYTLIQPESITVTSPNGGELWPAGSPQNITWSSTGLIANVKIEYSIDNGSNYATVMASTPNNGSYPWIVPNTISSNCLVRISDASNAGIFDVSNAVFSIITAAGKDDFVGTWDGQGVYYRNSDTGAWAKLASPATMIASGDLDKDGIDDIIGLWPSQGGIWVKYSQSGAWAKLSSTAVHIAAGDMNGDSRDDLLGTWDGQGVYYRDSTSGVWIKMASPATMITTGDIDGDGTDDLVGIWPSQGGVWVKYSQTGAWAKLSSSATDIASGDMNGDGRDDLLATWVGQGVYYRDSISGSWVKMASEATQVTCGDLDADGKADLIGIWPGQGGVWAKYSKTGTWAKLSSTAKDITAGVMRLGSGAGMRIEGEPALTMPIGGVAEGPELLGAQLDLSDTALDGPRLSGGEQKNLVPRESARGAAVRRIPGPGEPGFMYAEQENQFPQETPKRKKKTPIDKGIRKK
jgi:hypothetical protein